MSIQLYIGYVGEGSTDNRFLSGIISNTFIEIAFECQKEVTIEEVIPLKIPKNVFVEMMTEASKKTYESGLSILCIHADADSSDIADVFTNKFTPLFDSINNLDSKIYCRNIVPLIPIAETEAWMLADKVLLKKKIDAKDKSDSDLGIENNAESYSHPKEVIEKAIRIAQQGKTKRRRRDLSISDLYEELGQTIPIDKLRAIPSYRSFETNVRQALINMGYILPK